MKALLIGVLIFCLYDTVIGQESSVDAKQFLVRMEWSHVDLSENGITTSSCVIVFPSGHFHLERRLEQLPFPKASLQIYESTLDSKKIQQLLSILDSQEISDLPKFKLVGVPGSVYLTQTFEAQIPRPPEIQDTGYVDWKAANTPLDSDEPSRETLRETQAKAKTALQPLLKWFLELQTQNLPSSNAKPTFCQAD